MASVPPAQAGDPAQPLLGRKLYSPGTLAAYTALASFPIGYVLYGLNLKARGHRRLGLSWVCFGAACLALLQLMSARGSAVPFLFQGLGVFAAINIFQFESRPFALAVSRGATRARWWPPALLLLAATIVLLAFQWLT